MKAINVKVISDVVCNNLFRKFGLINNYKLDFTFSPVDQMIPEILKSGDEDFLLLHLSQYAFNSYGVSESFATNMDDIFVQLENLIKRSAGVDLLIHQVAAVQPELLKDPVYQVILDHHTKPEEAGQVFTRVQPKLAVFYHFVLLGTAKIPPVSEKDVLEMTRRTYAGPLVLGEDLMAFRIGRDAVEQIQPIAK